MNNNKEREKEITRNDLATAAATIISMVGYCTGEMIVYWLFFGVVVYFILLAK